MNLFKEVKRLKTLAERILEYRAKHNISAREFAKMCKLSLQTIYSIENGVQTPSKITRLKIENVLKEEQ